jgi:hypothetical protein
MKRLSDSFKRYAVMTNLSVERMRDSPPKRVPQAIGCDPDVIAWRTRVFNGEESPGVNGLLIASTVLEIEPKNASRGQGP